MRSIKSRISWVRFLCILTLLNIFFLFLCSPIYGNKIVQETYVTIELDGFPVRIHCYNLPPENNSEPYKTLIFFHGLPTTNAIWLPVMAHLSQMINVDSYAISFPGFGRSDAHDPEVFDYSETSLNRAPFKVADALGIDHFTSVVHDMGGPWFFCPATEPQNMARLEGLVVLDSVINIHQLPLEPRPIMQKFAVLLGNLNVPRYIIRAGFRLILEAATAQNVRTKFPQLVKEIETNNSDDDNRLAISDVLVKLKEDPLAFGGVCAETVETLNVLRPLLIWPEDLLGGLSEFQEIWPTSETVLVQDALHFLMLDQEEIIATAIALYLELQ